MKKQTLGHYLPVVIFFAIIVITIHPIYQMIQFDLPEFVSETIWRVQQFELALKQWY